MARERTPTTDRPPALALEEWDAASYERLSEPQLAWGRQVVDRICARGDEVALDAGCGTGRVTRLLADRLPAGHVIGVDASARMIELARERLADLGKRVELRRVDLLELDLDQAVDLVMSNATFHWILDHERLFERLFAALRSGGRLVAQCGGAGNIAAVLAAADDVSAEPPYREHLEGLEMRRNFAGPEETVARLEGAGFVGARAWLHEAPTLFDSEPEWLGFLETVVLRVHVAALPEELQRPFAQAVAERIRDPDGRVRVDYIRLNMEARRP
jgi:trans-aconitate 2-methyltransferase